LIRAIRANQPSFRPIVFEDGFNVILADRTKESTRQDTRNALGKSTLIEIIHFCLGANASPNRGLRRPALAGWSFTLDLELAEGRATSVTRQTDAPGKIFLDGDVGALALDPEEQSAARDDGLRVARWNQILRRVTFGLPEEMPTPKYQPTFRSLISYFARREPGGFISPFTHYRNQYEWDKQVNVAFLLELEWRHASEWQELKDRRELIAQLERASAGGLLGEMLGSVGELEAERVQVREAAQSLRGQLAGFRVLPEYERIEEEANRLTEEIHSLSNANYRDRRSLGLYETSQVAELPPDIEAVTALYEEAGVQLAANIEKSLEDVAAFHVQILENRQHFLEDEIDRLQKAIDERRVRIEELTGERARLLSILADHGALSEYQRLQERLSEIEAQLRDIDARIARIRELEQMRLRLAEDFQDLQRRAVADYEARAPQREQAIALFAQNSQALYRTPGKLIINITPNGFQFDVEISGSGSHGVNNMKIFCFDLMLAQLWAKHEQRPGFLIHDSPLYDGVDERQVALALERGARVCAQEGFQYIVTLNSDAIPEGEFSDDFSLDPYVRHRLTDVTDDGTLLGIRF
jgi:uncharacterized protein YydD (DUF2326 family)